MDQRLSLQNTSEVGLLALSEVEGDSSEVEKVTTDFTSWFSE